MTANESTADELPTELPEAAPQHRPLFMESAEHRTREEESPAPESEPVSDDELFFPRSEPAEAPAAVDDEPAFLPQSGPEPLEEELHLDEVIAGAEVDSSRRDDE